MDTYIHTYITGETRPRPSSIEPSLQDSEEWLLGLHSNINRHAKMSVREFHQLTCVSPQSDLGCL